MVLLDINHGIKKIDIMLLDMLESFKRNFIIVYTKLDRANDEICTES